MVDVVREYIRNIKQQRSLEERLNFSNNSFEKDQLRRKITLLMDEAFNLWDKKIGCCELIEWIEEVLKFDSYENCKHDLLDPSRFTFDNFQTVNKTTIICVIINFINAVAETHLYCETLQTITDTSIKCYGQDLQNACRNYKHKIFEMKEYLTADLSQQIIKTFETINELYKQLYALLNVIDELISEVVDLNNNTQKFTYVFYDPYELNAEDTDYESEDDSNKKANELIDNCSFPRLDIVIQMMLNAIANV